MTLPCITVREAVAALSLLDQDAKLYAWLPGSYLPVAGVMDFTKEGKAMLEVNVPDDSAIGMALR